MRIMLEGAVSWFSGGFLPTSFEITTTQELRIMFVFMSVAFAALCLAFVLMYRYALKCSDELLLNPFEIEKTRLTIKIWMGCMIIGLMVAIAALVLPAPYVSFAGLFLFLIGVWIFFVESRSPKAGKPAEES